MVRSNEFAIGVLVDPAKWDSKAQRVKGTSHAAIEANRKIDIVRAEISEIYLGARARGVKLSAAQIRSIFVGEDEAGCLLSKMSALYLLELKVKGRSKSTMGRYKRCYQYLRDYVKEDIQVSDVSRKHVSGFWIWLKARGYQSDYCNKIVQACIGLFRYGEREGYVDKNPFAGHSLEWTKELDTTCLTREEVAAIRAHTWIDRLQRVADSFLFMCYTGLHISDYIEVKSDCMYEYLGHQFMKVRRLKTGIVATFPITEHAKALIAKYGGIDKLPRISAAKMNDYLKVIASKLDITKNLTNKIARKTFTDMCINELGLSFEVVASMLGHTSTRQVKHYGSITERRIVAEWKLA